MRFTFSPRSRRQRIALSAIGVLGTAALLAGCSASTTSGSNGSYSAPKKSLSANITYAVWDQTQVKAIDANIKGFNKIYPNIHVNVDVTPWADYWTKLPTEASSGTLPDIFWLNGPNAQLYESNGKVAPITGEVKAGAINPSNYPKALDSLYALKGVQYGVPKDFDTIGLWYNKAIFKEAGVAVPNGNWTWADFSKAADEISAKLGSKGIYGAAAGMDGQTTYYDTIFQAGGSVISANGKKSEYDTPATEAGIKFWTDLIASKGSPTIQQLTDTAADQWFVSGKVAMYQGGDWARSEIAASPIAKDVQVAVLPKGVKRATVIHGVSNVVSANSKHKAAAQAFQVYLASKPAQLQQGNLGAVIPAFNGTQTAFASSMPGVNLQLFLDEVKYSVPLPSSKDTAAWNAFEATLLPKAFSGELPVNTALTQLTTQMNGALAKG